MSPPTRRTPGDHHSTGGSSQEQLALDTHNQRASVEDNTSEHLPNGSGGPHGPGHADASPDEMRACVSCRFPTMRFDADNLPRHDHCEPRHTYSTAPATSYNAGTKAKKGPRSELALFILTWLRKVPRGLTDSELQERLPHASPGSVSKRRSDLVKARLVVATDETRLSKYGRPSIVWKAVQ